MNILLYTVRTKFASVQHVSTDTVFSWLSRPRSDLVLFDTRAAAEFSVSHLPHAVHVDPDSDDTALTAALRRHLPEPGPETTTIACYCSLGYRSSTVATRLNRLRHQLPDTDPLPPYEAVNIEGSIFKWANEGKPLVDSSGAPTKLVHPFSKIFGRLLNSELWKFPETKA